MQPIRTLEDLIHAVTNSLGLISSHSQYVLDQPAAMGTRTEDLEIICDEAQRAAKLLSLVPRGLAQTPIQETTDASPCEDPGARVPRQRRVMSKDRDAS